MEPPTRVRDPSSRTPQDKLKIARTFRERLVGWMGRRVIGANEALLFPRCRSVHTFGMRVPIDVVMFDRANRIVDVRSSVPPRRIIVGPRSAVACIELPHGGAAARGMKIGEEIHPVDNLSVKE